MGITRVSPSSVAYRTIAAVEAEVIAISTPVSCHLRTIDTASDFAVAPLGGTFWSMSAHFTLTTRSLTVTR